MYATRVQEAQRAMRETRGRSAIDAAPFYHDDCIGSHPPDHPARIDAQGRSLVWLGAFGMSNNGEPCGKCGEPIQEAFRIDRGRHVRVSP